MAVAIQPQELLDAIEQLPPASTIIRRLLAVLEDPNSDIDDISKLIRVDTVLAAQVLRLANSAHYGHPGTITSIEEAIQQTGVNEIMRLVTSISARQLAARPLNHYRVSTSLLWQHTLGVAVAAEIVAERFLADAAAAYLAGLLHTIGIITLDTIAEKRGIAPVAIGASVVEWENKVFAASNAEIAAHVLTGWEFPVPIVTAVATRYEPPKPDTIGELSGVLYLASAMAKRIPVGLPPEAGLFELTDATLDALRMSREELAELELSAGQRLSRLKALF